MKKTEPMDSSAIRGATQVAAGKLKTLAKMVGPRDRIVAMMVDVHPTPEMLTAGGRSIGNTMRADNHTERAAACWAAMLKATGGEVTEPIPKNVATADEKAFCDWCGWEGFAAELKNGPDTLDEMCPKCKSPSTWLGVPDENVEGE